MPGSPSVSQQVPWYLAPCSLYSDGYVPVPSPTQLIKVSNCPQRLLFGAQAPLAAIAGLGVCFSIPPMDSHENVKHKTTLQKLAGIDYTGAVALVRFPSPSETKTKY